MSAKTCRARKTLADLPRGSRIIGSVWRYAAGGHHTGLIGYRAVIVAVHRGTTDDKFILTNDESIGRVLPEDIIEFAPIVCERDGTERRSWITSDAKPDEMDAVR